MKSRSIFFLSILLNVILIPIVYWQRVELIKERNALESVSPSLQATTDILASPLKNTENQAHDASVEKAPEPWNWAQVESPDYQIYISNLRKIGCPEETIEDIIRADVGQLFRERTKDFEASLPPFEYWKKDAFDRISSPEHLDGLKAIQIEKHKVLKALLGSGHDKSPDNIMMDLMGDPSAILDRQLGFLDETKKQAVVDVYMSFQDDLVRDSAEGGMNWEEIQQARKERDDALSQLLTPEEKYEVDLRISASADQIRSEYGDMGLTEKEFRDMYDLQQKVFAGSDVDINSSVQERIDAKIAYDKELKSLLGDQRYGEYAMTKDRKFQILNQFAESKGIQRSMVIEAYNIQNLAQEAVLDLNSQTGLTGEGRKLATQQIIAETDSALQRTFGTETYEEYRKNGAYMKFRAVIGIPHQTAQGDGQ